MNEEDSSRLDFGLLLISFKKLFFPKFELLNSGCGLSAGVAYLQVQLICRCSLSVDFYSNTYLIEHANHSLDF